MIFTSDNWAGAHPAISQALHDQSAGFASAYGTSALDKKVEATFNEIFGREVAVFFVGTGTAANSLALASVNRPGGVSFCHREAHMIADECGAPEFFSHGARLAPVDGIDGRIDPAMLAAEIGRFPPGAVHYGQPMAVSITQATEIGTIYSPDQIRSISTTAKTRNLPLHMDGARFANALVALGVKAGEMTADLGVDIVSFGGTKNGCWCAEALVFMNPDMAREMPFVRKRAAQLFSKSRFIAAQFDAYFKDGLWLELAAHSNAMARRLQDGIAASTRARTLWDGPANEVFAVIAKETAAALRDKGALFHDWPIPRAYRDVLGDDETLIRLVTSFATSADDVDRFIGLVG